MIDRPLLLWYFCLTFNKSSLCQKKELANLPYSKLIELALSIWVFNMGFNSLYRPTLNTKNLPSVHIDKTFGNHLWIRLKMNRQVLQEVNSWEFSIFSQIVMRAFQYHNPIIMTVLDCCSIPRRKTPMAIKGPNFFLPMYDRWPDTTLCLMHLNLFGVQGYPW